MPWKPSVKHWPRVSRRSRRRRSEPGAPSPYRKLIGLPFLLRNQAASALLSALITAENDRAARVRSTALDPDVEVLTARIEDLEKQLHSITKTYLAGLNNQVLSLEGTVSDFQRDLDAIPGKQLQYARLDRRVKALEEVHALLAGKLKEAEIAEAARDASVQVVDLAAAPSGPSSPNPMLNGIVALALGILLGIVAAIVREYRDKSVHTPQRHRGRDWRPRARIDSENHAVRTDGLP